MLALVLLVLLRTDLIRSWQQATPADATARLALTGLLVNAVVRQVDTGDYYMLTNAAAPSSSASWTLNEAREDYVDLAAEVEYVLDGKQTSYPTFTLRIWDDVSKGNEGTVSDGLPAYPSQGMTLTAFISSLF
jgi:predicted lysophospholipase L1 biosynthesis ABC-type transport system permease subunit